MILYLVHKKENIFAIEDKPIVCDFSAKSKLFTVHEADNISISLQLVSETECEKLLSIFLNTGVFVLLEYCLLRIVKQIFGIAYILALKKLIEC